VTGLQFWLTDYSFTALTPANPTLTAPKLYLAYTLLLFLAPLSGALFGATLSKRFGGSSSPQSLGILCFSAFCQTVVALPIPFITNFGTFLLMLGSLLFLQGLILPLLIGQLFYTLY
jgi:hypothetical protein